MSMLANTENRTRSDHMRTFSSADAKNHFGELIDAARISPVAVTKYDKPFVVVMSIEDFERLKKESQIVAPDSTRKSRRVGA